MPHVAARLHPPAMPPHILMEQKMANSVFFEAEFILLVATSLLFPSAIYVFLFVKRSISRITVIAFAAALVLLSGVDVILLNILAAMAHSTVSQLDDTIFTTEISLALYLLPAVFAGLGVNLLSDVLIGHLHHAERQYDQQHHRPPRQE